MKVFAVGGSVITSNLDEVSEIVESLRSNSEQIAVVTGAGELSKYQSAVTGNKGEKDLVGIKATRLHARVFMTEMSDCYQEIPETPEEIKQAASSGKNFVMGGLVPGYSTDAVGATVAELLDAELYIVTDVDGIYSEDPSENKNAEKYNEITVEDLLELIGGKNEPGVYSVVDEAAARIIQRSDIRTKLISASADNLQNPELADGTTIKSS